MRHSKETKENALDLGSEIAAQDDRQGHEKRISRYSRAKEHQEGIREYILSHNPELSKEAQRLSDCSQFLVFRYFYVLEKYRLIGGCSCKQHLLCALCALRRSAKTVFQLRLSAIAVLADRPELIPVLITSTVKDGSDLSERYLHLSGNRKRILQKRRDSIVYPNKIKSKTVLRYVAGGFGSYEFKKGKGSHEWHPHIHEIAFLEPGIFDFQKKVVKGKVVFCPTLFQKALQEEWYVLTGDSFIIDVRRVDVSVDAGTNPDGSLNQNDSLISAICEVSKYALKMGDLDYSDQVEAYKVLRGRRLTFTYGCLWGLKISDDLRDNIDDDLKLQPYVDLIYNYCSDFGYKLDEVTDTKDLFISSLKPKSFRRSSTKYPDTPRFFNEVKDYVSRLRDDRSNCSDLSEVRTGETENDKFSKDKRPSLFDFQ